MVRALLARPAQRDATWLTTTVTDDNDASWALFRGLARDWDAPLDRSVLFDRDVHFAGAHATEYQARIGPLDHRKIQTEQDRKSVVWGKSVSVRLDLGGRCIIKKKTKQQS